MGHLHIVWAAFLVFIRLILERCLSSTVVEAEDVDGFASSVEGGTRLCINE